MNTVDNTSLKLNELAEAKDAVALATGGIAVEYTKKDDGKILILLENTGAEATCTILKGNALQGTTDLEIKVSASKTGAITVESGKYANVFGKNTGKVIIKGPAAVKIRVIELP